MEAQENQEQLELVEIIDGLSIYPIARKRNEVEMDCLYTKKAKTISIA